MKKKTVFIAIFVIILVIIIIISSSNKKTDEGQKTPELALLQYYSLIGEKNYEEMYNRVKISNNISKEDFLARNKNIYEGIGANNIQIEIKSVEERNDNNIVITYVTKMNTVAGNMEFSNTARVTKDTNGDYKINWSSSLIFPDLKDDYKVRVSKEKSRRGSILDRNGKPLATQGTISCIGIVPGKLGENREASIEKIANILNISKDNIKASLSATWVKDDSFVPIKKITADNSQLKQEILQVPGIMIDSQTDRIYPYKESTSHITGYIQTVTAEELENLKEKGYNANSIIGKAGLEKIYEEKLRGTDGAKIYIEDANGKTVKTLVETKSKNGEDVKLTIDVNLQQKLYNQMKENRGFFVAMNPKTGEILALVSTPSYDANKFVLGMSTEEWNTISNDAGNPLYTRFLESWCPGSTFKPITAAIGLTSRKLTENDEFFYEGLSWQKDSSWGDHKVTTLKSYEGKKNLRNALVYSDNIYFAQVALKIGEQTYREGLNRFKFNENIDFAMPLKKSTYSTTEKIQGESILADSGYGQGQILVNPIHMASIYSAFANNGNMVKPYLEYKEDKTPEYLVKDAMPSEVANIIKEDLIQVVEDPNGTGHDAKVTGVTIAGKTGTAELKKTQDEKGDILGWFDCFTTDESNNQLLIVGMAENKGSSTIKSIIKSLF